MYLVSTAVSWQITEMIIRAFTDSDGERLAQFMGHWGPEADDIPSQQIVAQIRHCRERVSGELFLALDEDEIVAYLQMSEMSLVGFPPAAEISALLVHTELRGQGIGTRLIEFARVWAMDRGLKRLLLSSQLHRTEAHVLYRRCGFTEWKRSAFFVMDLM
jgi:GNAT superfamily N-acetyltransferase